MAEKEKTKTDEGKMEEPLPESFPCTPSPFTDGFMRETERRYSNHRKSLAWLAKNTESEDTRRKAKKMLEGRRSVYEALRDPEFGRMTDRSIECLQQVMRAEPVDPNDPSTFPDRKRLAELVGKYGGGESLGRGEDAKDDETDRRRAAFDRRRRSDEQHESFGAGRRWSGSSGPEPPKPRPARRSTTAPSFPGRGYPLEDASKSAPNPSVELFPPCR